MTDRPIAEKKKKHSYSKIPINWNNADINWSNKGKYSTPYARGKQKSVIERAISTTGDVEKDESYEVNATIGKKYQNGIKKSHDYNQYKFKPLQINYKGKRYVTRGATGVGMNCFIDSMLQVAKMDNSQERISNIATNLSESQLRMQGEKIETHSEAMNAIIAALENETNKTYKVWIHHRDVNKKPTAMIVGNGETNVHISFRNQHFEPMFSV